MKELFLGNSAEQKNKNKLRWPGYIERLIRFKQRRIKIRGGPDNLSKSYKHEMRGSVSSTDLSVSKKHKDHKELSSHPPNTDGDIFDHFFAEPIIIDYTFEMSEIDDEVLLKLRISMLLNKILYPLVPIEPSQLVIKRIGSALTNLVFQVNLKNPPFKHPTLPFPPLREDVSGSGSLYPSPLLPSNYLLRVYGTGVDEMIDRNKELYWLKVLGEIGIGARMLGQFNNGRLEEFLDSRTLTRDDICQEAISRQIATRMAELHNLVNYVPPKLNSDPKNPISLRSLNLNETSNSESTDDCPWLNGYPQIWSNISSWYNLVNEKMNLVLELCKDNHTYLNILEKWDVLGEKIEKYIEFIVSGNPGRLVLAHNDLQYGNILELSRDKELTVVDFEYMGYNYRGVDIATHFTEWMSDYSSEESHVLNYDKFPNKQERYNFYKSYIETCFYLDEKFGDSSKYISKGNSGSVTSFDITDERLESFDVEVMQLVPFIGLQWGLWGILQACVSPIEFDYLEYGFQRLIKFIDSYNEVFK
ncbi:hypothetical protein BB559_005005 [Furculomyces boomerangus]|uniref:Choline kinase N-terminal domain-containing protein n=2 Tax=Harpellales TaxID=61421 RepID=A0A2T9YBE8_9FUNG|nr:hypothetical protein BB559_005005 [Furculomyces boomerangus]PVZ99744.1 hypothetical protein BB558_004221 [Smittium angustum]